MAGPHRAPTRIAGHTLRKRFGQHFLRDAAVIDALVAAIDPRPGQRLLEIGPGLGALSLPVLARALALPKADFDAMLDWILALRKKLDVPHTLAEMGVKEADAEAIAADAVKDPTAGSNPRQLSQAEFEALTLAAIRGDLGGR